MNHHRTLALLAGALLLAPVLEAAETLGAESPQAAVEKLRAAAVADDFGAVAGLLAPPARQEMAKGLWAGTTMMIGMASQMGDLGEEMGEAMQQGLEESMDGQSEEAKAEAAKAKAEAAAKRAKAKAEAEAKLAPFKKRYDDLAKKYGLPTLAQKEGGADPAAIFAKADQVALVRDYYGLLQDLGTSSGRTSPKKKIEGELENLQIDGDKATGSLTGDTIDFVKIVGRWFITKLPKVKKPAAAQQG